MESRVNGEAMRMKIHTQAQVSLAVSFHFMTVYNYSCFLQYAYCAQYARFSVYLFFRNILPYLELFVDRKSYWGAWTLLGSHIWSSCINQLGLALTLALKQTSLLLLTVVQTNPLSSPMLPLRTALELLQRNRALYNLHMTFEYSDNCRIHVLHRCVKGLRQHNSGVKTNWMESGPFEGFGVVDSLVWKSPLVKLVILWVVAGNGMEETDGCLNFKFRILLFIIYICYSSISLFI